MNVIYGGGDVGEWLVTDDRRERDRVRRLAHDGREDRPRRGAEADADRGVAGTGRWSCARTRISSWPRRARSTARSTAPARFAPRPSACSSTRRCTRSSRRRSSARRRAGSSAIRSTTRRSSGRCRTSRPRRRWTRTSRTRSRRAPRSWSAGRAIPGGRRELYYQPTVVANVGRDTLVNRDETFGPIVPLISVDGDDDALAVANESHLGLQAAVYTRDLARAFRFAERAAGRQRRRERLDHVLGDAAALRRRGRDEDRLGPSRRAACARGHDRPAHDHPGRRRLVSPAARRGGACPQLGTNPARVRARHVRLSPVA